MEKVEKPIIVVLSFLITLIIGIGAVALGIVFRELIFSHFFLTIGFLLFVIVMTKLVYSFFCWELRD